MQVRTARTIPYSFGPQPRQTATFGPYLLRGLTPCRRAGSRLLAPPAAGRFPKDYGYLCPNPLTMPRYPNYPTTCDECKSLSLAYLRQSGLLRPGFHSTVLSWRNRGQLTGSVSLDVETRPGYAPYLRLHYTREGTAYDYRVWLEQLPSNLPSTTPDETARPGRYRMICPVSNRPATVLYMHPNGCGKLAHRLAYPGHRLYYDTQLENKRFRGMAAYYAVDRIWEAEYRKGRKKTYRGQPTKWYAALLNLEARTAATATPAMMALAGL